MRLTRESNAPDTAGLRRVVPPMGKLLALGLVALFFVGGAWYFAFRVDRLPLPAHATHLLGRVAEGTGLQTFHFYGPLPGELAEGERVQFSLEYRGAEATAPAPQPGRCHLVVVDAVEATRVYEFEGTGVPFLLHRPWFGVELRPPGDVPVFTRLMPRRSYRLEFQWLDPPDFTEGRSYFLWWSHFYWRYIHPE